MLPWTLEGAKAWTEQDKVEWREAGMYKIRVHRGGAEVKLRTAFKKLCKVHKRTELSEGQAQALAEKLATKFDSQRQSLGEIREVERKVSDRFQEMIQ